MASRPSTFCDYSLIFSEAYKPFNLAIARVETKTFIELLWGNFVNGNKPGGEMTYFFKIYDEAMAKIAEVDQKIKDPESFHAEIEDMNIDEIDELQLKRLYELGHREQLIRELIDNLQDELFDATMRRDKELFRLLLEAAAYELETKVSYLCELMEEKD